MLNIPLHALAYVLTPKYDHVSWLSLPAPSGGSKKKPHQDPEVQNGYMTTFVKYLGFSRQKKKNLNQLANR